MSGANAEGSVNVTVGGTSVPLRDQLDALIGTLAATSEAMTALAAAMAGAGDASSTIGTGAETATGALAGMGDAAEASASALDADGVAATETASRFDSLAAMARSAMSALASMGGAVGGGMGMVGGALGIGGMGGMGGGLSGLFDMFGGVLDTVVGKMGGFVSMAGSMLTGMLAFSALNEGIQSLQNFTDQMVQLNIATEKNQFSWKYLYGGAGNAQQLADWTKQFSMQIPYTRQSLLDAVTNLAPLGLSVKGVENYMPLIADLGATRAPNMDIAQVAQVIMSASMGYTRMLKYDLKINPEDLIKYGLDATGRGIGMHINDPTTLLPALQNYADAKGLTGASKDIAHNTFWGAWSSFMDRIQNFQLSAGSKLFANLKDDLTGFSSWIDTHSDQLNRFADLIANGIGGAFHTATEWVSEFMTGVGASGLFSWLVPTTSAAPPLTASAHQQQSMSYGTLHGVPSSGGIVHPGRPRGANAHSLAAGSPTTATPPPPPSQDLNLWKEAGSAIGGALKEIGEGWKAVSDFFQPYIQQDIGNLAQAFNDFKNSFTPQEKETLKEIGLVILAIPFAALLGVISALVLNFKILGAVLPNLIGLFQWFGTHNPFLALFNGIGSLKDKIGNFFGGLKDSALHWGEDLVTNLINGIGNKLADLGNMAHKVANVIAGPLAHSKPAYGPLANDDQWGAHLVDNIIRGMMAGTAPLERASSHLASAIAGGFHLNGGYTTAGSQVAGHHIVIINGSSTVEIQKIIDNALQHGAIQANSQTRAPGAYALYQIGTLGGLR